MSERWENRVKLVEARAELARKLLDGRRDDLLLLKEDEFRVEIDEEASDLDRGIIVAMIQIPQIFSPDRSSKTGIDGE